MAESSQYHVSFTGDTSDLTKQLNAVISTLNNMEKTTQKSGDDMDAMFKRLASTAATAFAGFSVKEFVKSVVDARGADAGPYLSAATWGGLCPRGRRT